MEPSFAEILLVVVVNIYLIFVSFGNSTWSIMLPGLAEI
jgi:hypothetical protein